jgi:hypothetical protein
MSDCARLRRSSCAGLHCAHCADVLRRCRPVRCQTAHTALGPHCAPMQTCLARRTALRRSCPMQSCTAPVLRRSCLPMSCPMQSCPVCPMPKRKTLAQCEFFGLRQIAPMSDCARLARRSCPVCLRRSCCCLSDCAPMQSCPVCTAQDCTAPVLPMSCARLRADAGPHCAGLRADVLPDVGLTAPDCTAPDCADVLTDAGLHCAGPVLRRCQTAPDLRRCPAPVLSARCSAPDHTAQTCPMSCAGLQKSFLAQSEFFGLRQIAPMSCPMQSCPVCPMSDCAGLHCASPVCRCRTALRQSCARPHCADV